MDDVLSTGPWSATEVERYLDHTAIPLRLSVVTPSGWPLGLSLWFVLEGGELLLSTRPDAMVVSCLSAEPRCSFEVVADHPPYRGVRGRGIAEVESEGGGALLERLLTRYLGSTDVPLSKRLLARAHDEVVVRITPVSLWSFDFTERMAGSL